MRVGLGLVALMLAGASPAPDPPAWTRPTAPFRVIGDIWYVGSEGLAAYAIRTRGGTILIDATMAQNVPAIERNLVAIGVPLRSVKMILVTHAHFDHAAGDAAMKRDTGATLIAGARDVEALETGIPPGEVTYQAVTFAPVKVDRGVRDGDTVALGGTTLTARATPGHTPGCTTWTMRIVEKGRPLEVVFPCSVGTGGNKLVGNARYPGIVEDYRRSFAMLKGLKADVVLPAHPEFAGVMERHAKGGGAAFVAPGLLREITTKAEAAFDSELGAQQKRM